MIQLKESVRNLVPYRVNDIPYKIKLDANEGKNYLLTEKINLTKNFEPNIYPDSDAKELRGKMAEYYGCSSDNIIVGNGSSDLINLVINAYCEKGEKVLSFTPSFSMYKTYCNLCSAKYVAVPCNDDFTQNIDDLIEKANEINPKIVIICTPNNPTGYVTKKKDIIKMLDKITNSIIIVDEAYIDFGGTSTVDLINKYDNLIVMRTLSKAFGLAALRVGCLIANEELVKLLWKVKVPYNLNSVSQYITVKAFNKIELVKQYVKGTLERRETLSEALKALGFTVHPSGSNFIFVYSEIEYLFEKLADRGILIRKFSKDLEKYYRITVGTKEENELLINSLKELIQNEKR